MNAEVLGETINRRLWSLFMELIRPASETLGINPDKLLEKMLANPVGLQDLTE